MIQHANPKCTARMSMNGHCLVCDAAAANGVSPAHLEAVSKAQPKIDAPSVHRHVQTVSAVPAYFPATLRDRIATWDDERNLGNSLIVGLKAGWCWSAEGEGVHVRGFDTVQAVRGEKMQPCHCAKCGE